MPVTDGTPMDSTWRLEAELFCGTETFRNHMDVRRVSGTAGTPPTPSDAIVTAFQDWIVANYFPDVTLNAIFLREILRYTTPPPHVDHPPIWEIALSVPGTANVTYGGAHFAGYLPQQVCIYVRKNTSGGRNGKMFMRNILTEADVQSTIGGVWAFSPHAGGFDPAVFNALAVSGLGPFFLGGVSATTYCFAATHLETVPIGDTRPIYSTGLTGVEAVRPTWNKTSR